MSTSRFSKLQAFGAALLFAAAAGDAVHAVERQPWPSLALTDAGGNAFASQQLVRSGNWIVLYVSAECVPCTAVLAAAAHVVDDGTASAGIVVIVAGDGSTIRATADRYPTLAHATWVADPARALAQHLSTGSVPLILGIRDRTIEWSVDGVLTNTADVSSVFLHWLTR